MWQALLDFSELSFAVLTAIVLLLMSHPSTLAILTDLCLRKAELTPTSSSLVTFFFLPGLFHLHSFSRVNCFPSTKANW